VTSKDESMVDPSVTGTSEAASARELAAILGRRFVTLTGAGISTASGIPDYRGPETRRRARNPIQWNAFAGDARARQRYWARSAIGWPRFSSSAPNVAHHALTQLQRAGSCTGIITQNVDGLHQQSGADPVVELHGSLAAVRCMECGARSGRGQVQARIERENPDWAERYAAQTELAPDGDAELSAVSGFVVPRCARCQGELRPAVVFFGEGVSRDTLDAAWAIFDRADALLVAGSSLAVFSGLRFVREATARGMPVAIVNLGETRGDEAAALRVNADLTRVLPALARYLAPA
jgi:NAD-dependent SIR2 family protein deacetylase